MDYETRYKKLNERQREAVNHIDGPLMVVAGPGTGKTELLSMRAANILRSTDTLPQNILCLTFTESGATAMRKRLSEIIGPDAYKVAIHTFHSFGSEVINQNGEYFYQGAEFRPASELSSYELLREIFDSLEYSNPLAGKMGDDYTHLGDTLGVISELRRSGLTSDELLAVLSSNESVLDACEKDLAVVFANRISKATIELLTPIATRIATVEAPQLPAAIPPLSSVLALSLAHAVDDAEDTNSTKPITAWKNRFMRKDEQGRFVFKDRVYIQKLRAVSYLYYQYLLKMQEAGLYDFDDMVLKVVHATEVFPDLRFNLQERYQYIMVDEFQDTNLAQSRILQNLTTLPTGDAPNVMVVGDDDQAIYSFQGAEVGNIMQFRDRFEDLATVTLTDNYRSADTILSHSRGVVVQAEGRLEDTTDSIDKTLTAHHAPASADVSLLEYGRIEDERRELARRVKSQIENGARPCDIAVLARRHHELIALLPYFYEQDIAVNYERRDNVLESDVIVQLVLLARVVTALADGRIGEADAQLPRLLAHPAWNFSPESIWQLSLAAYKNRGGWLEEMNVRPEFTALHAWLIESSRLSLTEPAEALIDRLIGTPDDDAKKGFVSPYYSYFFGSDRRDQNSAEYLVYLEALRTVRAKLREYRPDRELDLVDFIEFIELHERMGSNIVSVRVRSDGENDAVNLMTAHKSKGLEFDHVHILGAVDTSWGERVRTRSRLIGYPENLQIAQRGDTVSERIRLFFVAMTRARNTLSISYSTADEAGKTLERASFLLGETWQPSIVEATEDKDVLSQELRAEWFTPLIDVPRNDMKSLLTPVLEQYKLSATHLNAFLDVPSGGPQYFLVNNLLRFPQAKGPNAGYGSAIHATLQRAHDHLTATKKKKPVEDILQDFETQLKAARLSEHDHELFHKRGVAALQVFLTHQYDSFAPGQRTELSFRNQQSTLGAAVLTGALDLVETDEESRTMTVIDYKTGKPASSWKGADEFEKIKLHKYRQQLLFYKLLVEHSRDYSEYTVEKGVLQFVEPSRAGQICSLELSFDQEELERFSKLVEAVYSKIVTLDLPDVTDYPPTLAGIVRFEDDLLGS